MASKPPANRLVTCPYPPVTSLQGNIPEWVRRTQTSSYRRRAKRFIQELQSYLLHTQGTTHVTRLQRDAMHYFLDVNQPEERRPRGDVAERTGLGAP